MRSKLAAVFLLLSTGASAQTADDLIVKYVEARGGVARLKAIQTVRIERTIAATFNVYLDPSTFLERRHETTLEVAPNRRIETTITFGDWREIDGVKFPFAIEEERDAPGQTFVFYTRRIEVNVPLEDALFLQPPS